MTMSARVPSFILELRDLLNFCVKETKLNVGSKFAFETYLEIPYF
jgi:hypothetical protein